MGVNRVAVVTGANKGVGFEICRQLICNEVLVVLTARDEKRGTEAVEKLKESGLGEQVVFHLLDVTSPDSIASLADFVKREFGKLDILVNNAGIGGAKLDPDALGTIDFGVEDPLDIDWESVVTETYELAEACITTNYYGTKRMIDAFIPLLLLSDSPRIVNVSSRISLLKYISNEWAIGVFKDAESLTAEKIDMVLNELQKDLKESILNSKRWARLPPYTYSKTAMNAYSRIVARKYPSICINCVCPGPVKTDMNYNNGTLPVEEGAKGPVRLAMLSNGSPSGLLYVDNEVTPFE